MFVWCARDCAATCVRACVRLWDACARHGTSDRSTRRFRGQIVQNTCVCDGAYVGVCFACVYARYGNARVRDAKQCVRMADRGGTYGKPMRGGSGQLRGYLGQTATECAGYLEKIVGAMSDAGVLSATWHV